MPEAFSSISDMRVVIDSSTEKLEAGLTVAKNLVARFASEGGENLSFFDRAVGGLAGGIGTLATKANGVLAALEAVKLVVDSLSPIVENFASQTGAIDEFETLKTNANELQSAILSGLQVAFDGVKESAVETASSILGFDSRIQGASESTSSFAADALKKLGDGFAAARQYIEDLLPASRRSLSSLEHDVRNATSALTDLEWKLADLENGSDAAASDPEALDRLKQQIEAMKVQIFVMNQLAGAARIVADGKADAAVESTKSIDALKAEVEAMELNVETMRMSTAESAIYRAELKARAALEQEGVTDQDAIDRVLEKLRNRYLDAADGVKAFNDAKKHDDDVAGYLDRLDQETDALRDRVAVLGMATVAAAAYIQQARNMRAISKLGDLDPETMAKINEQLAEQAHLNQKLADADELRKRQQSADRDNNTVEQTISSLARQTAQIRARTSALFDSSEAGRVEAIVEQQLLTLKSRHIELTPERIAAIRAEAQAQVEAAMAQEEAQKHLKLVGDIGNAVTSNLESAFRRWTNGAKVSSRDMAQAIIRDLEMIAIKAAVLAPLQNLLTGGQGGGGGLLGSLVSIMTGGMQSAGSWAAGTSVIPAFAEGGDFQGGPMLVGEKGPELLWPKFPGTITPNSALQNYKQQGSSEPTQVEVNVINNSGAPVSQDRRQSGGMDIVDIVIGAVNSGISSGKLDDAMGGRFAARPIPRQR